MNAPPLDVASEFAPARRRGGAAALEAGHPAFGTREPLPRTVGSGPSEEALRLADAYADAVERELKDRLAAGRPYSTWRNGAVVWVHPDGTLRTGRADGSPVVADAA